MPTTPPPIQDWDHKKGYQVPTKNKEAIRELSAFAGKSVEQLADRYNPGEYSIRRILAYDIPERARAGRKGPKQLRTDTKLDEVIEYASEKWANRIMKYDTLITELDLKYSPQTLMDRLHQRGYYRCTACQKPYLTAAQVTARLLWAITHIFWTVEWLKVLWSDKVAFLIGGRTAKEKVTRKRGRYTYATRTKVDGLR